MSTTAEAKALLRRQVRAQLAAMAPAARQAEDEALFDRFLALPQLAAARTVFVFYGMGTEPDTARLIPRLLALGKTVGLPRMLPGRAMEVRRYDPDRPLVPHPWGIPEPDTACPLLRHEDIDLALVPALCYDRQGFRLGMGGGYYDRWLPAFCGVTAGLCRTALLQDKLPTDGYDRPVELVITPQGIQKGAKPSPRPL